MKKFVALSLALTMALSLAACGGDTISSGGDTSGTGESSSSDGVTLRLVNGKIEVDEQLKKLAELYKEETGGTPARMMGSTIYSNGTEMLALNIYKTAASKSDYATAQAKAVLFFIMLAAVSLIQVRISNKREVEM